MLEPIQPMPLGSRGKMLTALMLLGTVALWALALFFYFGLPEKVPVHFGLEGKPTRYGSKLVTLLLPAALSLGPLIFLLVTKYRFALMNRYPHLLNLPAFFLDLGRISEERRAFWVNRYFEAVLGLGVGLTAALLFLEYGILFGTTAGQVPAWVLPFVLLLPVALIVPFLMYLSRLKRELGAEAQLMNKSV